MLKSLMLRRKIDLKKAELEALRAKNAEFATREADLEAAIAEATTEEEQKTVDEAINAFNAERDAAMAEESALENEVAQLEAELTQEEEAQRAIKTAGAEKRAAEKPGENGGKIVRTKFFNMSVQERDAMFAREDVKNWIDEIRSCIAEKRALTNVGVTIPEVFLGLLRENLERYSKLYSRTRLRPVGGTARQAIMGTIPEAIWTECCANLNELDLGFSDAEVDCYKVGGFFAICNAVLEDSEVDLADEVLTAIGQAIGLALDKAILFGRNAAGAMKMPKGVVTRLVETSQPANYPATARPWVDLHTSNVITIASTYTGIGLFQQIVLASGAAKGKYSRGEKTWVMNETTRTKLIAEAMSINAAGAVVSGINGTMPVIGGDIVVLDFVPDNVIIGGYFDLYLLAERAGQKFASSEHVRFIQDQTVFKGTARYDGMPLIGEAFVVIGIGGTTPSASMTFAADEANNVQFIQINTATSAVTVGNTVKLYAITSPGNAAVTWTSGTPAKATVAADGTVTGVAAGTSVITATANGKTASCTVTVS